MSNAGSLRAGERAALAAILTLSLAAVSSAFTREGLGVIIWALLAIGLAASTVGGLHKRLMAFIERIGGRTLVGFLAIFLPVGAILIFLLYGIGIGFVLASGIPLATDVLLLTFLAFLIVLGNLIVLVLNAVTLLRKHEPV